MGALNVTLSPEYTQNYILEVTADIDGFKDYDTVTVQVRQHFLTEIFPNPSNSANSITVQYYADDANNAKLIIVPLFDGNSNEVILNPNQTQTTVSVSTYAVGQYLVILECDGFVMDYKNIVIN